MGVGLVFLILQPYKVYVYFFCLRSDCLFVPRFRTSAINLTNFISIEDSSKTELKNQVKDLLLNDCKPKQNVLLLEIVDTNFSTIQSIFFHYGNKSHLPLIQQNDIFTYHARYNHKQLQSSMPADTVFVIVLKNPKSSMKSFLPGYNRKEIRPDKSAIHLGKTFSPTSSNKSTNYISFNLGLDMKYFDNIEMIRKFIQTIDSQFHWVIIAERMEESLVHLQRILCWTLDDMIVFRLNVQHKQSLYKSPIALKQKTQLFNNADELLYKYFDDKLTRQTEVLGKMEMKKQIISLRRSIKFMYDQCVKKLIAPKHLKSSKLTRHEYQVLASKQNNSTDKICNEIITSELIHKDLLRRQNKLSNRVF